MEMRIVLRRILERTSLRLMARRPDRAFRAITLAPKHGVRVSLERRAASR
jgi:cytochrome P450